MEVAEKKKPMVPELRFGEFSDEWLFKDFGVLAEQRKSKYNPDAAEDDAVCIELESISKESSLLLQTFEAKQQKSIKNVFEKGDVLFGKLRPNLRKYLQVDFDGVCSSEIWVLNGLEVSNEFLFRLIQTNKFLFVSTVTTGSKMPRADWDFISNYPFAFPSHPEQKKIADFLSAVDARIKYLNRKKELLEQYKKGVMQKLFSQELRFKRPDGSNYPDWEEKRLGEVVIDKKGAMKIGPFGSQLKRSTFVEHGFKVYGQENIFIEDFDDGDRYITENHFNSLKSNEILPGDFVISTMGTIGKCTLVPDGIERGIMDSHMIRLRLNPSAVVAGYLAQIFRSFGIQKQIKRFSVGGIMDGLSMGIINELKFVIPSVEEQQKIADFLSALDRKIEAVSTQTAKTQQFKKGLLQKMFV